MAFIAKIRKQSGFLVGLVIVGFLLTFLLNSGSIRFFSFLTQKNRSQVGSVAGKSISKDDYERQLERIKARYPSKSISDKVMRQEAWHSLVQRHILQREYSDLDISVTDLEAVDIVQGNNIHTQLKKETIFFDKTTKAFDKRKLIAYLQNLPKMSKEEQINWYNFEKSIIESRKFDKILNLIKKSIYYSDLYFQYIHDMSTRKVLINYLYIPYANIESNDIKISDEEINAYIEEHKPAYQVDESMKIKYVTFNISPSEQDIVNFNAEINALCESFLQTKDDLIFAKSNTDGDVSSVSLKFDSNSIPTILKGVSLKAGTIVGPLDLGYIYRIYKVSKVNHESAKTYYELAVVEKKLVAGDASRNIAYATANRCATTCKKFADLEKWALTEACTIEEATITKNETRLRNNENTRSLIHWLYNNKIGAVSSVFETENSYIIAVATAKINSGTAPIDMVRDEIARRLQNKYKSEKIFNLLNSQKLESLYMTRDSCGLKASFVENCNLHFSTNILPEAGIATKAIGAAFSLAPGEKKIIADDYGVFVIELLRVMPSPDRYTNEFQTNIMQSKFDKDFYASFKAMEELANVVDSRYKFY